MAPTGRIKQHGRRSGAISLILVILLAITRLTDIGIVHAAPTCASSGSGGYQVTVCLTAPADGAVASGEIDVSASVTVTGSNPGIRRMVFWLDGAYLITDFQAPYTFILPTQRWVDGLRVLQVGALMRDGFESSLAGLDLTFSNGVVEPPVNTNTFQPASGTPAEPGESFVLAATGDGASGEANALAVTNLLAGWDPNMFLYLGDVYEKGSGVEFRNWYGDATTNFGRFRSVTNPTIGNHEYEAGVAPGYFDYWDNVPDYYSFDAAGWHLINLNSNSQLGEFAPGSPQYEWLANDLAASAHPCTLVYFHHPVFSVGPQGSTPAMMDIWRLLADSGVDLVLTGHEHSYQRWLPLDRNGNPAPDGITQFVVGTGGHAIQSFIRSDSRLVVGADSPPGGYGALRLHLQGTGAAFRFENIQGTIMDSGSVACTGAPPDTTPPTEPTDLMATATSANRVDMTWTAASDDVGVTGYEIEREGQIIGSVGPQTSFADTTVAAETSYGYRVRALDLAGNPSPWSNVATVTTPALSARLFADGFESGDLSKWTTVSGLTVQQGQVFSGAWAARAAGPGASQALKSLGSSETDVYYRIRFRVASQGSNVNLLKFRTASSSILGVYLSSTGKLSYRNDVAAVSRTSSTTVAPGGWHELQVRVQIAGASSAVTTWLDGAVVGALTRSESLGTTPIGVVQLGENSTGRTFDVAFDDVEVSREFVVV